jgi:hypothetical protein
MLLETSNIQRRRKNAMSETKSSVTGGDRWADTYRAATSGEETVGGSASVPGQNDSDRLAAAVGIEIPDREPLHLREIL